MTLRIQRQVPAPQLAVWEAWLNLAQWSVWVPGVRRVEIDWTGDPVAGNVVRLRTATGWRAYQVIGLNPPETWTWRRQLGPWTVTHHHHLLDRGDGATEAAVLVSFEGPAATLAETLAGLALRPLLARRLAALAALFTDDADTTGGRR